MADICKACDEARRDEVGPGPGEDATSRLKTVPPAGGAPSAAATLAERQEQLRFALGAASAMTYDLDLASGTLTISDNFESLIGLDPGSFLQPGRLHGAHPPRRP